MFGALVLALSILGGPACHPCAPGFVDDGGTCVPEACGVGTWGKLLVDENTLYVDISAPEGGDGSEAAPFASIQAGLDVASAAGGGLVAVAAGFYPETLNLGVAHDGVQLAGRCHEMLTLDPGDLGGDTPGILIEGDARTEVGIAGITITSAPQYGIHVTGGRVTVRDALLVGNAREGMMITGAASDVTLERVEVRETSMNDDGNGGHGVVAEFNAHLVARDSVFSNNERNGIYGQEYPYMSLERCVVAENDRVGVEVWGGVTSIRDTSITDTHLDENGAYGIGLFVYAGARVEVESSWLERNAASGVAAWDGGGLVTLRETTIQDNLVGIQVAYSASLTAEDCDVAGNQYAGVFVQDGNLDMETCEVAGNTNVGLFAGEFASATLRETTIRDTLPDENGNNGLGIALQGGAILDAEVCAVTGNTNVGLMVDEASSAHLVRTTVRDTLPNEFGEEGVGIYAQGASTLYMEACEVAANTWAGIGLVDSASATLHETTVRDTVPNGQGQGVGITVMGATLDAEGCDVSANTYIGIQAYGASVTLRDTTVRDTTPNDDGVIPGIGIYAMGGATLDAENCTVEATMGDGILVDGIGTAVMLRETTVRDTRSYGGGSEGYGIIVGGGASMRAEGCLVESNTQVGLLAMQRETYVILSDSTVSDTIRGSSASASLATGVSVQEGARMSIVRTILQANEGPGLLVNGQNTIMECVGCTIADNQFAGAVAIRDGTLIITDSTIEGTTASINLLGGAGVYAWPWNEGPPTVILTNTLIRDNPIAGVWLIGNGSFQLTGNTISGGIGEPFGTGSRCGDAVLALDGVQAWDGSTGLLLQDNELQDASGAGIFLDASSAWMSGNAYSGNALDLVVQDQSCDPMPGCYAEAPLRDLCPEYSHPTCYQEFFFEAIPAEIEG